MFVDGCFWHCCPDHGTIPKSNQEYWVPKLKQNVERDKRVTESLLSEGWQVIRIWEHTHPVDATKQIMDMLVV